MNSAERNYRLLQQIDTNRRFLLLARQTNPKLLARAEARVRQALLASPPSCDKQRGFALASGIFLLVILAALGAFIVAVSTTQHVGSALDVQGARAYQAARAGMEWGLYRQLRESSCVDAPGSSFTFPAAATSLQGFTVTVTCAAHADAAHGGPTVYEIQATACNQPNGGACPGIVGANYVERRMRVTF